MSTRNIVLESKRLRIRKLNIDDIDNVLTVLGDPEAMRFFPTVGNRHSVREFLERAMNSYAINGFGPWGVELKESGEFVGYCGLFYQEDIEGKDEIEILYGFAPRFWNLGYATEAAVSVKEYAFEALGIKRCVSMVTVDNERSAKVAERNGMKVEKEIIWRDRVFRVYSIEASAL